MANRIQLDGDGYRVEEGLADGAVNPGNIVEKTSAGKWQKHGEEGGFAQIAVAVEDALQGNTVDDQYDDGDRVFVHIENRGTRFQAILKNGENVVIGEALISDGSGRLIAQTSRSSDNATKQVIAYAEEASDQSGEDGADTLIAVRSA